MTDTAATMNVLWIAWGPVLGLAAGYLASGAILVLARAGRRWRRPATADERARRLHGSLSGDARWLDTDEIGLSPATVEEVCARAGWRVARAYPVSDSSWLQYAVPPGGDGHLRAGDGTARGRLGRGAGVLLGVAGGVVVAIVVSRTGQLEALAVGLGVAIALVVPMARYRRYWSRARQWEWVLHLFRGAEARYAHTSTSIPAATVSRLAADLGYEYRRTEHHRYGRSDVYVRREL